MAQTEPEVYPSAASVPVVAAANVQGDSLTGFKKPYETFAFGVITDVARFRQSLATLIPLVSSLDQVWLFNAAYRALPRPAVHSLRATWLNIAITWQGLRKLWPDAPYLHDAAFSEGMASRRQILGDVPAGPWKFGGPPEEPDLVLLIASDDEDELRRRADDCFTLLKGMTRVWTESCSREATGNRDTFGFRDGVSQPRVHCRLDLEGTPYLDGNDGVATSRLHDFLLTEDPYKDSTLVVFRRYVIHEQLFRRFLSDTVAAIRRKHDAAALFDEDYLASRLIGRWQNGADVGANIERRYAGKLDESQMSIERFESDALHGCPHYAHLRKANPRNDVPADALRPILRRGIGFLRGNELGLMFVCYQSSIERQFEYIVRHWLNNPNSKLGAGHDPIAGQNATGLSRQRAITLSIPLASAGMASATVDLPADFTTVDGGCYAMSPSIALLNKLAQ